MPADSVTTLITSMISLANTNKVGLVVKGRQNGVQRGYSYIGSNTFQANYEGGDGNDLTLTVQ